MGSAFVVVQTAPRTTGAPAKSCSSNPWCTLRRPCEAYRCLARLSFGTSRGAADGESGDIDLNEAMANARANLAEGRSPGAGLESAFDQADAAFADLIVTSVDDQGVTLEDEVMGNLFFCERL